MNTKSDNRHIEFYFDPISPYVWLASTQLDNLKSRTGYEIIFKPILFAGLLNAHGHKGPAEIPAKREYIFRDVMRRASNYGIAIEGPPNHPFVPLLALRICTAIEDNTIRAKLACQLLDAAWSEGADITDAETLRELLPNCNVEPEWALAAADSPETKKQLIEATDAAIKLGIFGVPTFRIDDQLFWGDDRIDELIRYCSGQCIDEAKLDAILSRSPAARVFKAHKARSL